MQELVIDRIEEKKPRSGGKPFYVVYGQNGEEITTFEEVFKGFGKGTRLNFEPKIDGTHTNFAKWELIELIEPDGGTAEPSTAYKRDTGGIRYEYQLKARLQAIELASMEARTAFTGVVELVKAEKLDKTDPKAVEALEWASARIAATKTGEALETDPSFKGQAFPHIGALLTWCAKLEPPVTQADFLEIVGVKEEELPKVDITEAYQLVKDHLAERENPARLFDK